jgi:hypothetical protein
VVVVKVSEVRRVEDGSKHAKVLLRATPEKLVSDLMSVRDKLIPVKLRWISWWRILALPILIT